MLIKRLYTFIWFLKKSTIIDIFGWNQNLLLFLVNWVGFILKDIPGHGVPDDLAPGSALVVGHFDRVVDHVCRHLFL